MSDQCCPAPFAGRWFPVPEQGMFQLTKEKEHKTAVVWLFMLAEANLNPKGRTSSSVPEFAERAGVSPNTVRKAHRLIVEFGLAQKMSERGRDGVVIFAMTRIANFNGKPGHADPKSAPAQKSIHPKKPVGNWEL